MTIDYLYYGSVLMVTYFKLFLSRVSSRFQMNGGRPCRELCGHGGGRGSIYRIVYADAADAPDTGVYYYPCY